MYSVVFTTLGFFLVLGNSHGLQLPFAKEEEKRLSDEEAFSRLPHDGELFEGDIVMDDRLRRAVWGEQSKKSALKAVESNGLLWPNCIVYYEIDPDFPKANYDMLMEAFNEFHKRTCIRFKKRTDQKAYIYYTAKKDECSSSIGRLGGRQVINLGIHCLVLGTFLHENMHALGFIHEHSRPDRDDYVEVKYKNIEKKEWNNFQKYKVRDVDNLDGKFNFMSILLYRNDAFTKNGEDTLVAWDKPDMAFGQREKFSVGDVDQINHLYDCKAELADPNYDGLFKSIHLKSRRKRRKDIARKRVLDYLRLLQRKLDYNRRY